jgi:uncharacterized protein (TIGR02246 family)
MFARLFTLSAITTGLVLSSLVISNSNAIADSEDTYYTSAIKPISHDDIKTLGQDWGIALGSRDANQMTALYDQEAVLLATFSNELDTAEEIEKYFIGLLQKPNLKVVFNAQNVRVLDDNTATNSGLYTFSYTENSKTVKVPARYTL